MKPRYVALVEKIHHTWPHFSVEPGEVYETTAQGWDYEVFYIRDWVLRMGRTIAANTHLRYEIAKLRELRVSLPIPNYVEHASWGGLYKKIPGRAISRSELQDPGIQAALREFVGELHDPKNRPPGYHSDRVRIRWESRYRILEQTLRDTVFGFLTVKQQRQFQEHFRGFFDHLKVTAWDPVLLHGDLSGDHILCEAGHLTGIIDFGDLTMGDPAFDWAGWEMGIAPPEFMDRIRFYRWLAPTYTIRHALEHGTVEEVESAWAQWIICW